MDTTAGEVAIHNFRVLRRLRLRSMAAGRRLMLSHEGALLLGSFSGMTANAAADSNVHESSHKALNLILLVFVLYFFEVCICVFLKFI